MKTKNTETTIGETGIGTNFREETVTHKSEHENGAPGLPLMSAAGNKMAAKTAPRSAFKTDSDKIPNSSVDAFMRPRR
jgi:hypothetical protein